MEIELLVRARIADRGRFLIAHAIGATNTYLPGGHVDAGESMPHALERELLEELGITAEVGRYLGVVEHTWEDGGGKNHEINHIFEVALAELHADQTPMSLEDHIQFIWLSPAEFDAHNLQPAPLRQMLSNAEKGSSETWWGSTIGKG